MPPEKLPGRKRSSKGESSQPSSVQRVHLREPCSLTRQSAPFDASLFFFFFFKRFPLGLIIRKDIRSCFFISSREKRILFFPLRLPPFQRCVKHSSFFPINFSPPRNFQFSIEFRASRAPKTISRYGSKGNEKQSETNQSLMETATREQWRRGGKVTPVKKKKRMEKIRNL